MRGWRRPSGRLFVVRRRRWLGLRARARARLDGRLWGGRSWPGTGLGGLPEHWRRLVGLIAAGTLSNHWRRFWRNRVSLLKVRWLVRRLFRKGIRWGRRSRRVLHRRDPLEPFRLGR